MKSKYPKRIISVDLVQDIIERRIYIWTRSYPKHFQKRGIGEASKAIVKLVQNHYRRRKR